MVLPVNNNRPFPPLSADVIHPGFGAIDITEYQVWKFQKII